jgi:hypothetical protein
MDMVRYQSIVVLLAVGGCALEADPRDPQAIPDELAVAPLGVTVGGGFLTVNNESGPGTTSVITIATSTLTHYLATRRSDNPARAASRSARIAATTRCMRSASRPARSSPARTRS